MKTYLAVVFVAVVVITGCAEVVVRKVDPSVQVANQPKGFRYYLPRPFVAVKKPFPVAGGDFFVAGTLTEDGRVFSVDAKSLPDAVRTQFGVNAGGMVQIPAGAVVIADPDALPTPRAGAQAATDKDKSKSANAEAAKPTAIANDAWLTGSTVAPNTVVKGGPAVKVNVVLAKGATFNPELSNVTVGLIPIGKDGPESGGFVAALMDAPAPKWSAAADGKYSGTIDPAKLQSGAWYTIGVRFDGTHGDGRTGAWIVHRTSEDLSVSPTAGTPAKGPDKPATPETESTGKPEQKQQATTMTEGTLTIAGDPLTKPLEPVNDWFDVLYMPDFDEQYAVEIKGGLGLANGQIAMENGWMVERAAVQIDNREMGKFVFETATKFIDLALAFAAPGTPQMKAAAEAAKAQGKAAANASTQGATDQSKSLKTVLLRVRYVMIATPGLYPVLKSREKPDLCCSGVNTKDPKSVTEYMYLPYRPYTVIAFNVQKQVVIEWVDPKPQAGGSGVGAIDVNNAKIDQSIRDSLASKLKSGIDAKSVQSAGVDFTFTEVILTDTGGVHKAIVKLTTTGDKSKMLDEATLQRAVLMHVNKVLAEHFYKGSEQYTEIEITNLADLKNLFKQ